MIVFNGSVRIDYHGVTYFVASPLTCVPEEYLQAMAVLHALNDADQYYLLMIKCIYEFCLQEDNEREAFRELSWSERNEWLDLYLIGVIEYQQDLQDFERELENFDIEAEIEKLGEDNE